MSGSDEDLVLVGRIARSHGLRGQVVIDPETDFAEDRFAPGATVLRRAVPGRPLQTLRVASVQFHRGRPIVRFEGIDSIEQADALGRIDLWVRAADRPPLPAGSFYHDALIGCRVETTSGEAIGTVTRIEGGVGVPVLVIASIAPTGDDAAADASAAFATPGSRPESARRRVSDEVLVPLAEAICPVIDPDARRIVIDPPDGLIDVNR